MNFVKPERNYVHLCTHIPNTYINCYNQDCSRCDIADRYRKQIMRADNHILLFRDKNCLRMTEKGGGLCFYQRPVVLKEKTMERLGIEVNLLHQIAIAYDGPGCLPKNVVGPVDIYLFLNPTRKFTVGRHELYGVPDEKAVKRYDDLFFMDLHKVYK